MGDDTTEENDRRTHTAGAGGHTHDTQTDKGISPPLLSAGPQADVTITSMLDFFELNIALFKSNKDTSH